MKTTSLFSRLIPELVSGAVFFVFFGLFIYHSYESLNATAQNIISNFLIGIFSGVVVWAFQYFVPIFQFYNRNKKLVIGNYLHTDIDRPNDGMSVKFNYQFNFIPYKDEIIVKGLNMVQKSIIIAFEENPPVTSECYYLGEYLAVLREVDKVNHIFEGTYLFTNFRWQDQKYRDAGKITMIFERDREEINCLTLFDNASWLNNTKWPVMYKKSKPFDSH